MKKIYLLLLFGITCLLSCSNNSRNSHVNDNTTIDSIKLPYFIDIEKQLREEKSVSLSSIGKILEYIPLETTPNSMMGDIQNIQFTTDYIFITARSAYGLLQFDRKGKFIRIVGSRGRGPGEYRQIRDFCLDQNTKKIYINSCWSSCEILEYNFNGQYISSFKQPLDDNAFLVYDTIGFVFEVADYSPGVTLGARDYSFLENNLIITDFTCKPLFKIKRNFMRNSNYIFQGPAFYFFNSKIHFLQFGVDTLKVLEQNKLVPYAIFNLGESKMDPNLNSYQSSSEDIAKKVAGDISVRSVLENTDNLFTKISFGLSDSSKYCIYNKKTSETSILKENGIENDIDGGIKFWPKYVYGDSVLVDYTNAYKFLETSRSNSSGNFIKNSKINSVAFDKVIKNLTETSNPVLILLRSTP
jgi:hypothetical protein